MISLTHSRFLLHLCALLCVIGAVGLVVPALAGQEDRSVSEEELAEAETLFDRLYGAELRKLRSSRDSREAVDLAQRLYSAARADGVGPAFATHLLEHAHELGSRHRAGYEVALNALERLAEVRPENRFETLNRALSLGRRAYGGTDGESRRRWAEKLIDLHLEVARIQKQRGELSAATRTCAQASPYASAAGRRATEDLRMLQRRVEDLLRLNRQVDSLRSRLEQNPSDEELATRLVLMLLLDLDDRSAAREVLEDLDVDAPDLKERMDLAAKDRYDLSPDEAWELAHWYVEQADQRRGDTAARLLAEGDEALATFLEAADMTDDRRTEAELLRERLIMDIRRMAREGVAAAVGEVTRRQVNLFDHLGDFRSREEDHFRYESERLIVRTPETAPWHWGPWFRVSAGFRYEMEARIVVTRGGPRNGRVRFYFPVDETTLVFELTTAGSEESGRTLRSRGRPPKVYGFRAGPGGEFERDSEIRIDIDVRQVGSAVDIRIDIDGKRHITWTGSTHDLVHPGSNAEGHPQQFRIAFPPDFHGAVRDLTITGEAEVLPENTSRL